MFYKVLEYDLTCDNIPFTVGLNIDLSPYFSGFLKMINFYPKERVPVFLEKGCMLAFIEIPKGSEVFCNNNIYRSKRINITKVIKLSEWSEWKNSEFCESAVKINPDCLKYIEKDNENYSHLCKLALSIKPFCITLVKNPTYEMHKLCVEINPFSIAFMKGVESYRELCIIGLKRQGVILQFIENQDDKIVEIAINQNPFAIQFAKNLKEDLVMLALTKDPDVIDLIEHVEKYRKYADDLKQNVLRKKCL